MFLLHVTFHKRKNDTIHHGIITTKGEVIIILLGCYLSILFSFLYHITFWERVTFKQFFQRSKCDVCGKAVPFYLLFPIIGYCLLNGQTRCCRRRLHPSYLIGECIAVAIGLIVTYSTPALDKGLLLLILVIMLALSCIDAQTLQIPIHIVILLLVVLLLYFPHVSFSGIVMGLAFHMFYFCFKRYIGYGDILILSIFALFFPWQFIFILITIASFTGSVYAMILYVKKSNERAIPLIPFLAIGFFISAYVFPHFTQLLYGGL